MPCQVCVTLSQSSFGNNAKNNQDFFPSQSRLLSHLDNICQEKYVSGCQKKQKNPSPKSSQTGFLGPGPVTGFVTDLLSNRGRNAEKMRTLKVTGLALYNFTNHPNSLLSRLLACCSGGGGPFRIISQTARSSIIKYF